MNDSFEIFNHPYAITKVAVIAGYSDNSGNWIPESTIETAIKGHISDLSQKERSFIDPGLIMQGLRKFACKQSVRLQVGHRLKITEVDKTISEWIVHEKQNFSNLLSMHIGISRETFLIKRKV